MKHKKKLIEEEIDKLVIAEADDMTKWEKPIAVKPTSIRRLNVLLNSTGLVVIRHG